MKSARLLIPTLGFALLAGGSAVAQWYSYSPQSGYEPQVQYRQANPEAGFRYRGFEDGMIGADRDFQNHRRPDVNNRDEFRNPHFIPGWARQDYREGFRRGYYQQAREIYRGYR